MAEFESPSSDPLRTNSLSLAIRLVLELLVVFLGVYGAFWAERYRDSLAGEERAREISEALAEEVRSHVENGRAVWEEYSEAQSAFDSATARGEFPVPWYIPWEHPGPSTAAWAAARSTGGAELLGRELFYRLAKYSQALEIYGTPLEARDPFVEEEILPWIGNPDHFYLTGTADLKPLYHEYVRRQRILLDGSDNALKLGEGILRELRERAWGHSW